jgi:hypothetical protein
VIGDIMPRGKFAWINIQGQYNEIGVWIPLELTKGITYKGNYRLKGTGLRFQVFLSMRMKNLAGVLSAGNRS